MHTPPTAARRLAIVGAILVLSLLWAAPAGAADSDAPPGAPPFWLPNEDWVNEHWLPYEEADLLELLGTDHREVVSWLASSGGHTLGELAESRGWAPQRLARRLLAPWKGTVPRRQYRLLRSRTQRTFTQAHLAQHMFGHTFHVVSLTQAAPFTVGVPAPDVVRLRSAGHSREAIAAAHGISSAEATRRVMRVLRKTARRGVRAGAMSAEQARFWLRVQRTALPRSGWLVGVPPVAQATASRAPSPLCHLG